MYGSRGNCSELRLVKNELNPPRGNAKKTLRTHHHHKTLMQCEREYPNWRVRGENNRCKEDVKILLARISSEKGKRSRLRENEPAHRSEKGKNVSKELNQHFESATSALSPLNETARNERALPKEEIKSDIRRVNEAIKSDLNRSKQKVTKDLKRPEQNDKNDFKLPN